MDERLLHAAENNAVWCDLVCRSHGVPTETRDGVWAASERSPELYPDAVTLRPAIAAAELLRRIDDGPGCSVKDSFADLDLAAAGFQELFSAQWFFRDAGAPGVDWSVVDSEARFEEWADAAGLAGILRRELLGEPEVRILAAPGADGPRAGAIASLSGPVVGVSNVFAITATPHQAWAELPGAVAAVFPGLPLVGYEQDEHLRAALASGFEPIGELRVWLRTGDGRTAATS